MYRTPYHWCGAVCGVFQLCAHGDVRLQQPRDRTAGLTLTPARMKSPCFVRSVFALFSGFSNSPVQVAHSPMIRPPLVLLASPYAQQTSLEEVDSISTEVAAFDEYLNCPPP